MTAFLSDFGRARIRLLAFFLGTLLLTGCGWHLREAKPLPEGISKVSIQAPNQALEDAWVQQLSENGVTVTTDSKEADATLVIENENFNRRVLSVDQDTGKTREFELAYTATVSMKRADGSILFESQTVRQLRNFVFDEFAVIGAKNEQDAIYQEMRADAIQQLLLRIQVAACSGPGGKCEP